MNDEQAKKLREPFPPDVVGKLPKPTKKDNPKGRLRNTAVIDRLLFRTDKTDTCWLWLGSTNPKGYGHIRGDKNGQLLSVHRVSFEFFHGAIPEGLEIDHLCSVRNCVNPAHLEAVDHATNNRRGRRNQNHGKTHCKRGHVFAGDNLARDARGNRVCRTCQRDKMRAFRARKETA